MPYNADGVGHRDTDTSRRAAEEVDAGTWRNLTLNALRNRPMTADEVAEYLGAEPLTIRPRVTELRNQKRIRDTGQRRKNRSGRSAAVWAVNATEKDIRNG